MQHPQAIAMLRRSLAGVALIACCLSVAGTGAAQQRNPLQEMGRTVLDIEQAHYRFESFTVSSDDGSRTWRVRVGIPQRTPAAGGLPAFWMLDGNGALMEFDRSLLAELATQAQPQVLVFVGYDNDLRIDSPARTRDYTFLSEAREGGSGADDRVGGGADAFLEVIERRVRPEVARRVALDPQRQALWGHSLAGLFVLHALYERIGAFQTYASGSPSLWWRDGALLGEAEQRFVTHNTGHPAHLVLSLGGGERARDVSNRDLSNPRVIEHLRRIEGAPPDAAATLAGRLAKVPGLKVDYREFEGLTHGPMFRASLMDALHRVAGIADRSATPRPQDPGQ